MNTVLIKKKKIIIFLLKYTKEIITVNFSNSQFLFVVFPTKTSQYFYRHSIYTIQPFKNPTHIILIHVDTSENADLYR